VLDIIPTSTVPDIIFGVYSLENHFIAKLDGELIIKILPIAHNDVPTIAHNGFPCVIKVLIQTPAITHIPPMEHPTLTPNLSNIKLHGIDTKGCIIGLSNIFNETTTLLYPNFF
jgi:hypothetical protein